MFSIYKAVISNDFVNLPGNCGFSRPFSIFTVFPHVKAQWKVLRLREIKMSKINIQKRNTFIKDF